jgi:hypothetical protein
VDFDVVDGPRREEGQGEGRGGQRETRFLAPRRTTLGALKRRTSAGER